MKEALSVGASNRPMLLFGTLMLILSVVFGAVTAFVPLYAREVSGGNAGFYLMLQALVIVLARFVLAKRIPSDGIWHARFVGVVCMLGAIGVLLLSLSVVWGLSIFYAAAVMIGAAQALLAVMSSGKQQINL